MAPTGVVLFQRSFHGCGCDRLLEAALVPRYTWTKLSMAYGPLPGGTSGRRWGIAGCHPRTAPTATGKALCCGQGRCCYGEDLIFSSRLQRRLIPKLINVVQRHGRLTLGQSLHLANVRRQIRGVPNQRTVEYEDKSGVSWRGVLLLIRHLVRNAF